MGTQRLQAGDETFDVVSEPIEVTSMSRPDVAWAFTDPAGHVHRWHADGLQAVVYDASRSYDVPSVLFVVDERYVDEDGEERERGHYRCRKCGARVVPGLTADMCRTYISGPKRCYINGQPVTVEQFRARLAEKGIA